MTDIEAIKRGGGLSKDQVIAYFGVVPRLLIESGSTEEDISDMIAYIRKFTPGVMIRKIHHHGRLMIFSHTIKL